MKKILIVTGFFEPHKSGIITYIKNFTDSLKIKNYQITVLTTKHNDGLKKIEYLNDIKVIRCKPSINISRGFYSIELVLIFLKIYKEFSYVNLHLPLVEIFPICFFLRKKQTIINYHCLPEFPLYLKFIKIYFYFFGILSFIRSKFIIVLSEDYFKKIFLHKIFTKNLIELPPYVPSPIINMKQNFNKKKIKIGYLGRICEEKGLKYLILLSNNLVLKKIDHELIIAGDIGDYRFKKYVNSITVLARNNKSINFIGKLDAKQKEDFYNNLDLFVLPSTNSFEAFGIVQLEAMSYGIPVIASNINGVRTVIQNTKNGYIFQNKSLSDLIEKFYLFRKNNFEKEKVRKNLFNYYSKEVYFKKISKLF